MPAKKEHDNDGLIATNKKAYHDYIIMDKLQAGVELCGTEVKSCRAKSVTLLDGYVRVEKGEARVYNVHISPYDFGNYFNHDPKRVRRLLLHKNEILRMAQKVKERGLTIIPLRFYLSRGKVKVEIAICKGKTYSDKRDTLRERQDEMDARRSLGTRRKGSD